MNANCMSLKKAVAAACCEGTLVYTLARQRAKAGRLYVRMSSVECCSKSDLDRCETIVLSATPRVTATSPSNLALSAHRPLHVYGTNMSLCDKASANNFGATISLRAWLAHAWHCESHERMQKVSSRLVLVAICKVERGPRVHATAVWMYEPPALVHELRLNSTGLTVDVMELTTLRMPNRNQMAMCVYAAAFAFAFALATALDVASLRFATTFIIARRPRPRFNKRARLRAAFRMSLFSRWRIALSTFIRTASCCACLVS